MKLLAALGIVALVLLGCSKASAPTKEQYAAAADGVCTAAHDEVQEKWEAHLKTKPDDGKTQRFVRATFIPRLRAMTQQLRSIQPPENDGQYLFDIYASYDHALDLLYSDGPATPRRPGWRPTG
jgi:hypothetical protein